MSETLDEIVKTTAVPDIPFELNIHTLKSGVRVVDEETFINFIKWGESPETSNEEIGIVRDKLIDFLK